MVKWRTATAAVALLAFVAWGIATFLADPAPRLAPARAALPPTSAVASSGRGVVPGIEELTSPSAPVAERAPARDSKPRHGRVLDAASGKPLAGAIVGLPDSDRCGKLDDEVWSLTQAHEVARSGSDGAFTIPGAVGGQLFTIAADGFGAELIDRDWLGEAANAPLVIALKHPGWFVAHVTDDEGAPLAGIDVRLIARAYLATSFLSLPLSNLLGDSVAVRSTTDASGTATITGVPADIDFDAELFERGARLWRDTIPIHLRPLQYFQKPWRLLDGVAVSGRVVDQFGEPVEGASVDGPFAHCQTDDRGRFFGLPAELAPAAFVYVDDSTDALPARQCSCGSVGVVVDPGERGCLVKVKVFRGVTLRGRLVSPGSRPVGGLITLTTGKERSELRNGARVLGVDATELAAHVDEVSDPEERWYLQRLLDSVTELHERSEDGTFELGGLVPDERYTLHALSFDGLLETRGSVEVRGDRKEPVVLRLLPRKVITVEVVDGRSDARVAAVAVTLQVRGSDGKLVPEDRRLQSDRHTPKSEPDRIVGLEPGQYDLIATTPSGLVGALRGYRVDDTDEPQVARLTVRPGAALRLRSVTVPCHVRVSIDGTLFDWRRVRVDRTGLDDSEVVELHGIDGVTPFDPDERWNPRVIVPAGRLTLEWTIGATAIVEQKAVVVGSSYDCIAPTPK